MRVAPDVLYTETLIEVPWLTVKRDSIRVGSGLSDIDIYYSPPRLVAGMIPVTKAGVIILVRQYRHAIGRAVWEFPIGRVDPHESALEAAARETAEETGYVASRVTSLHSTTTNPGQAPIHTCMWVGHDAEPTAVRVHDPIEVIEIGAFYIAELDRMVASGEFCTADSVAAYYHAKTRGLLPCE